MNVRKERNVNLKAGTLPEWDYSLFGRLYLGNPHYINTVKKCSLSSVNVIVQLYNEYEYILYMCNTDLTQDYCHDLMQVLRLCYCDSVISYILYYHLIHV